MSLEIHLLGSPRIVREQAAAPRGRKAWALLALLVLSETAVTRERAAAMLFPSADDPRGALRWSLGQLRGSLGGDVLPDGCLELVLPDGAFVDVNALTEQGAPDAVAVPGCGRELLEGMGFPGCFAFEAWLLSKRRYLVGVAEQALREAAVIRLAEGDAQGATVLAIRLVELNPYDENFQELLVRSYAEAGDVKAAQLQVRAAAALVRRELGRELAPAVVKAAVVGRAHRPSRASLSAQFELGISAVRAGAIDSGVESLRMAAVGAQAAGDSELEARSLAAVGSALVHAARGGDEEAAIALHRARVVAERGGHLAVAAVASNELGYVEVLRGRYARAAAWLTRAANQAGNDDHVLAAVHRNRGMALSDLARYSSALDALERSCHHARRAGDSREECFALSLIGRIHLLRGELPEARAVLDRSLGLAEQTEWTTFRSWPEALLADAELQAGERAAAATRFEHAFALGCHLQDPCWEAVAQRGLGRIAAATGDTAAATAHLLEARQRAVREPDAYLWVAMYALDALCEVAVASGHPRADAWIADLRNQTSRAGMRELLARSHLHDARRGNRDALVAGRALAAEIDNAALVRAFA